jgi:hypothetical protein
MKIIQSFWTKPFLQSGDSLKDSRLNGGWPARKYNYFSWALSCLQIARYYKEIELITDDLGKFLLIDKMELPYSGVSVELNKLEKYNAGLWALGKILAYKLQQVPFLHVDSDIFIWNEFDDRITKGSLIAQNKEAAIDRYSETFNEVCRKFDYVPGYLKELEGSKYISCSNAGIMGGTDIPFFQNYTQEVFYFLNENSASIEQNIRSMNSAYINVVYEQIAFNQLARKSGKEITYLFPDDMDTPRNIGFFHESDNHAGFVHCLGTYKQNRLVHELLEIKLKTLYPDYYERIMGLINSSEI